MLFTYLIKRTDLKNLLYVNKVKISFFYSSMRFGSLMSSDSNAFNSYNSQNNIYNCNIIVVYCLNAYLLFPSFKNVLRQTACG